MLFHGVLTMVLALAGFASPPAGAITVEVAGDLALSEDDTVSGAIGMRVGLDESAWDEEEFGPAEDAAAGFEFTAQDLEGLARELVAGLEGVTIEVAQRGDDPFGQSGFELGFEDAPFEAATTAFERLRAEELLPMRLSLVRQAGQPHSPEGGGQQHLLDGVIDAPTYDTPAEIDLEVEVTVTFAGLVYTTNGELDEQTVTWTDSGEVRAIAAPQAEGRPWQLWLLLGAVPVLLALRLAQQGHRRTRERRGEIPPPRSEIDGFLPVHR